MTREETKKIFINMRKAIIALEKQLCEDISEDGTLTVYVEDGSKVSRVLVCGDNHFGGLYYPEQELCEDTISRQAAIDAIERRNCSDCNREKCIKRCSILDAPTIIEADKQSPSYLWKCERCGKLIPYMADFCYECADELLGEPPKPFKPKESEDKE